MKNELKVFKIFFSFLLTDLRSVVSPNFRLHNIFDASVRRLNKQCCVSLYVS